MNHFSEKACEFAQSVVDMIYVTHNLEGLVSCFSKEITCIGPGNNDFFSTQGEVINYFTKAVEEVPTCCISEKKCAVVSKEEKSCIVMGKCILHIEENVPMFIEIIQRVTMHIILEDGNMKINHFHISSPYEEMQGEGYFPNKISTQSYNYMQRVLAEKTEVIEMITKNINGGLKGSNDDDTYSYFYVNEGLPELLGYTYEEFMEMSGGSAVGAVYPPDLPKALKDCADCFAEGNVYSTEYRIRKKNGELIWVKDSGRKVRDNDGEMKINSIIMEITDLKKAYRDQLTELFNATAAELNIEEYLNYDLPKQGAMMVIDIDNFKRVNDTFGHLKGNDILIEVSNVLKKSVRKNDIVARVGGDEFLIFLKDINEVDVKERANRVLNKVKEIYVVDGFSVSCSIGITLIKEGENSYKELFEIADRALYESKRNGKGCFTLN